MGGTNQCNHIQVPYNPNPGKSLGGRNNAPNETLPEIEFEKQTPPTKTIITASRSSFSYSTAYLNSDLEQGDEKRGFRIYRTSICLTPLLFNRT